MSVLVTGCFDVLHVGHIHLIEQAAKFSGWVFVGVNSDAAVRQLKGPTRPINNQLDRMRILMAIRYVSDVFVIDSNTVDGAIRAMKPSVWVKGGDWTLETLNPLEVAAAREVGARIEIVPALEGYSSTKIIERMKR